MAVYSGHICGRKLPVITGTLLTGGLAAASLREDRIEPGRTSPLSQGMNRGIACKQSPPLFFSSAR